jgi:hypothetical protein
MDDIHTSWINIVLLGQKSAAADENHPNPTYLIIVQNSSLFSISVQYNLHRMIINHWE